MKRREYLVTCSDGRTATRHAWNSAQDEMTCMVRETAREEQQVYELDTLVSVTERDASKDCVRGTRTWHGRNGRVLTFTIVRCA